MLFGLPEMKVFAETSSDPRIKALWARLKEARKKNALWCEEVNTLREQLRWRDAYGDPPTGHGDYLVVSLDFYCKAICTIAHWDGEWPLMGIQWWRPIGPLPGE